MSSYDGKKVFITGGSAGIGRTMAIRFAREGADVIICARGQQKLEETVAEMQKVAQRGDQVLDFVAADVTDRDRMTEVAAEIVSAMGGLDIVVANTGYAQSRSVAEATDDHFHKLMDVNFFRHVNTIKPLLPHFMEQRSGTVVLVSSMLAVLSVWGYGGYSASKFAVRGFAEALRQEMLLYGVRVKLFLPPTTDTPGLEKENKDKPPITLEMEEASSFNATHSAEKVVDKFLKWLPKKRFLGYATFDSWFQYFASRYFPNLTLTIADGEMKTAIKRLKDKGVELNLPE